MKSRTQIGAVLGCVFVGLLAAVLPAFSLNAPAKGVEGIWVGKLDFGGQSLRIVLHVSKKPDGMLTGTLDSPDQGASGIPASVVTFKTGVLHFEISSLGASFEGKSGATGTEIAGTFKQGGASLPLTLTHTEKALEGPRRPQTPQRPYPYLDEDITFPSTAAGVKLAGTLTLPKGSGPFPSVVLISGSGPNARNEEVAGHKLFLVLADYLTRRGIAVLRYDKRGIGQSTGSYALATTIDFTDDALAGVAFLKTRKEIDPTKIGLIGHSEGGLIAPLAATRSKDVAYIVLMAGPGMTGEQILYRQGALIAKASGAPETAVAVNRARQEKIFALLKENSDPAELERKLKAEIATEVNALPEAQRKTIGSTLEAQNKMVLSPWFRYFVTYDPVPTLMKVTCPVLALNGSHDLQVPPKEDLAAIEAALKAGGNTDYTVKELPELNHLFQTSKTGSPAEYSQIEETLSPVALQTMGDWILAHTSVQK